MVSRSKGTRATSVQTPVFKYLPGQEELAPRMLSSFERIFKGDMSSPEAQAMSTIVGEAGMREAAQERRRISETRGMSTPARQRAVAGAGEGAVSTMARVPQEMWGKAAEFLSGYATQAPATGTAGSSRQTGGGGWGVCCFIFCAANEETELAYVRRYKDSFYNIDSTAANGYKLLAGWLVPKMFKYPLIKATIKWIMVKPMMMYAKYYYEGNEGRRRLFYPVAKFWSGVYSLVGWIGEKVSWTDYMRLHSYWR